MGKNSVALMMSTPLPLVEYIDLYNNLTEYRLKEIITLTLNDNMLLTHANENDCLDYILEKMHIYDKELLGYTKRDLKLAKGILAIMEQVYIEAMSRDIDTWTLIQVEHMDSNTIEIKIYF